MSAINENVRAAIAKVAMIPSHVAYRNSVANWRAAQRCQMHTIKLVDLHTALHTPKEEPLHLHSLKLHDTLPVSKVTGTLFFFFFLHVSECKQKLNLLTGSATAAAREMSTSTSGDKAKSEKKQKPKMNVSDVLVENGAIAEGVAKSLQAAISGINPWTGKKMSNEELERFFGPSC